MEHLPIGTIVDFDTFSTLVVGEDMLLVYEATSNGIVREGQVLLITSRGPNDWTLSVRERDAPFWCDDAEYWVKMDWNGRVKASDYDPYDYWTDDVDDWDLELDESLNGYDEYDW